MARLGRVAWTRGSGCRELATALSKGPPIAIEGDLRTVCITEQITLLVGRKLTSFDLVPMAVPRDLDLGAIDSVTAAVGDGPHSPLAVKVAAELGKHLGVPAVVATAFHATEARSDAEDRLARLAAPMEGAVTARAVEAENAAALVETLPDTTLLIIGAPGGSWFYRQIYGPGHRLLVAAPSGVVVVRSAPKRCFHAMVDPTRYAVGAQLSVEDAKRVVVHPVVPVTDEGMLVGIVRETALTSAAAKTTVGDVMEPPVAVTATEPLTNAEDLAHFLDGGPIPVADEAGKLVGVLLP